MYIYTRVTRVTGENLKRSFAEPRFGRRGQCHHPKAAMRDPLRWPRAAAMAAPGGDEAEAVVERHLAILAAVM